GKLLDRCGWFASDMLHHAPIAECGKQCRGVRGAENFQTEASRFEWQLRHRWIRAPHMEKAAGRLRPDDSEKILTRRESEGTLIHSLARASGWCVHAAC